MNDLKDLDWPNLRPPSWPVRLMLWLGRERGERLIIAGVSLLMQVIGLVALWAHSAAATQALLGPLLGLMAGNVYLVYRMTQKTQEMRRPPLGLGE